MTGVLLLSCVMTPAAVAAAAASTLHVDAQGCARSVGWRTLHLACQCAVTCPTDQGSPIPAWCALRAAAGLLPGRDCVHGTKWHHTLIQLGPVDVRPCVFHHGTRQHECHAPCGVALQQCRGQSDHTAISVGSSCNACTGRPCQSNIPSTRLQGP
jgi:hypothetical protein